MQLLKPNCTVKGTGHTKSDKLHGSLVRIRRGTSRQGGLAATCLQVSGRQHLLDRQPLLLLGGQEWALAVICSFHFVELDNAEASQTSNGEGGGGGAAGYRHTVCPDANAGCKCQMQMPDANAGCKCWVG